MKERGGKDQDFTHQPKQSLPHISFPNRVAETMDPGKTVRDTKERESVPLVFCFNSLVLNVLEDYTFQSRFKLNTCEK